MSAVTRLSARVGRLPSYAVRSTTGYLATRRLVRRWPELADVLVTGRTGEGGGAERRDAVRAAAPTPNADVSVLVPTKRPRMIENLVSNAARQSLRPREVVLVFDSTSHSDSDIAEVATLLGDIALTAVEVSGDASLGDRLNTAIGTAAGEWLARMDDDDWYGPEFLADSVRAADVSGASMVGKAAYPVVWTATGRAVLRFPGMDYRFVSTVAGGTMMWNRERASVRFPDRSVGEDGGAQQRLLRRGGTIFASDRFQYVLQREADATWIDTERRLESSGPPISTEEAYSVGDE